MNELVVVGGGPAGMAAADAAVRLGVRVTLVDSAPRLGGQIYRQSLLSPGEGGSPASSRKRSLPARFRSIESGQVELILGASVWSASRVPSGFTLRVNPMSGGEGKTLNAKAIVLATGASELALPFPGWELPGVSTAGAAQALLKSQGVLVGHRVLVAGSGPLLLPVAASLAHSGAKVVGVVEACSPYRDPLKFARVSAYPSKVLEALGYLRHLAIHRVPVLMGSALVRCDGEGRVQHASVARLDKDWHPIAGSERTFEVDAVCTSFGFVPRLELCRQLGLDDSCDDIHPGATALHDTSMAASVPGVFVAGELTGIAGAVVAELEGRLAGNAAASYLGRSKAARTAGDQATTIGKLRRAMSFADLLGQIYTLQPGWMTWPNNDTLVCRCEDVSWGTVRRAAESGAMKVQAVRGLTRCGMGYCQGRTCGPAVVSLVAALTGARLSQVGDLDSRPVMMPVALGEVAKVDELRDPEAPPEG